jgi:hypothetical protein
MRRLAASLYLSALCSSAAALLAACSSAPPVPDWQLTAKGALDRSVQAYLQGNSRVEAVEFALARRELARTGQADLLARAELTRCAARVASLVFEGCAGFATLATDAGAAQRAYADYLQTQNKPQDTALLPEQHRPFAAGQVSPDALKAVRDPLAQLVAAAVLLQSGRAEPGVMVVAAETASAQGWSRPLLAWLNAQLMRAKAAGDAAQSAQLERRIALVSQAAPARP